MKKIVLAMLTMFLCMGITASAMALSTAALVGASSAVASSNLKPSFKDTAFAKLFDGFKMPSKAMTSGDVTITFSGKFNETPNEELYLDDAVDTLNNSKFICDVKFVTDENGNTLKLKLSCEYFEAWVNYDATNANDKKLMAVAKMAGDRFYGESMYYYINLDDLGSLKNTMLDTRGAEELALKDAETLASKLTGRIKLTQNGNAYTIVINEAAIKDIAKYIYSFDRMKVQFNSPALKLMGADDEGLEEQVTFMCSTIMEFLDKLDNVKLFAPDAIIVNVTTDDSGDISALAYSVNIQTNAYDIAEVFDEYFEEDDAPAPREDCGIDLTLKMEMDFSNVNNADFTMPILNDDNSYNILQSYGGYVNVVVDGRMVDFYKYSDYDSYSFLSAYPIEVDGRVLVPIRAIADSLNAEISWNEETEMATITYGGLTIILTNNQKTAQIGDAGVELDVPAQIVNGRLFVPVRFVAQAFNAKVEWLDVPRMVVVTSGQ